MNRIRILIVALLLVTGARPTAAQWNVARFGAADPNQMYVTVGFDPALITSVGYARDMRIAGQPWQLGVEAGVVAADFDVQDFRARLVARSALLQWRSMRLIGSAAFITRGTENTIYRALNFGADFTGTVGVYQQRWFLAGEFGYDEAIITYLTHSDWYREHYYPDAKDGWYLNTDGTFHYGLTTGVSIGQTEIAIRAGQRRTEDFQELSQPFYMAMGVGVRF
ncbi:MAG TPA: hypothetical protein VJ755_12015 [Gemmatimonadales bacterium]|nr:hypothetical protein [Gemmatimonadales bacterium]